MFKTRQRYRCSSTSQANSVHSLETLDLFIGLRIPASQPTLPLHRASVLQSGTRGQDFDALLGFQSFFPLMPPVLPCIVPGNSIRYWQSSRAAATTEVDPELPAEPTARILPSGPILTAAAPLASKYRAEYERLKAAGLVFTQPPVAMGPVTTAVLEDTCSSLVRAAHVCYLQAAQTYAGYRRA